MLAVELYFCLAEKKGKVFDSCCQKSGADFEMLDSIK